MLARTENFPDSSTSKKFREWSVEDFRVRAVEEWGELAGCLAGTHRHSDDFTADFLLESSQVFYWLACAAVSEQKTFAEFMVDNFYSSELQKLEAAFQQAGVALEKMLAQELAACAEKGYLL